MLGYKLTTDQYNEVQGQFYTPYEFFNCVQDINDIWYLFLSTQDGEQIFDNPQWNWIQDLPEGEYIPKPAPPFPGIEN